MRKKWTYHRSWKYYQNGKEYTMDSQLYSIGIYCFLNSDPAMQFVDTSPHAVIEVEKELIKKLENNEIQDLVFGNEITVIKNEDGFYREIANEH